MLNNKINLPKGSYHAFCRKMYGVEDCSPSKPQTYFQNQRRKIPKTVQTQRLKKIDQFHTFQEYMSKLNNKQECPSLPLKEISKTVGGKYTSQGSRPSKVSNTERVGMGQQNSYRKMSHKTERGIKERKDNNQESELRRQGTSELIGAFLPFFKVKLQREQNARTKQKSEFRIDNRKFKLKSLLVEENKYVTEKWFPVI